MSTESASEMDDEPSLASLQELSNRLRKRWDALQKIKKLADQVDSGQMSHEQFFRTLRRELKQIGVV